MLDCVTGGTLIPLPVMSLTWGNKIRRWFEVINAVCISLLAISDT